MKVLLIILGVTVVLASMLHVTCAGLQEICSAMRCANNRRALFCARNSVNQIKNFMYMCDMDMDNCLNADDYRFYYWGKCSYMMEHH